MKRLKKGLLAFMTVLIMSFSLYSPVNFSTTVCFADFGDSNDYSDSGSGGWSDSGSDSWSSSSYSWDSDSDSDSDSDLSGGDIVVGIITVIVIIVIVSFFNKRGGGGTPGGSSNGGSNNSSSSVTLPDRTQQIAEIIRKEDEFFDATDLVAHGRHIFVEIQNAWSERNLEPVRDMLHPNLYDQTQTQVNAKIRDKLINKLERISVTNAYITSYRREKEFEYVTLFMDTQMVDYQIREDSGEVVAGNKTTLWKLKYKMTLTRSIGIKTPKTKDKATGCNCPNCSAPLDITAFGKCEYCGTIVTTGKYGWVVSSLNNTKHDTRDEGIQGV